MKIVNRFIALTKRILCRKMYIAILLLIVVLTGVYQLLPDKSQSADIRVAMYCQDTSNYFDKLLDNLDNRNSIYTFYSVDSKDKLINDVKSGYAECGYSIPEGFFQDYVTGNAWDNPMSLYITPSSTFHTVINETVFSSMVSVCAEDILLYAVNNPDWDEELKSGLEHYRNSPEVFTIADTTSSEFSYENMIYHINLPITELVSILLLFSGLLGLLLFLHDKERKMYVALSDKELIGVRSLSILTSILPVALISMISLIITFGIALQTVFALIMAAISFLLAFLLGFIIRKSTLLEKVLPLIMLTTLIAVFIKTII